MPKVMSGLMQFAEECKAKPAKAQSDPPQSTEIAGAQAQPETDGFAFGAGGARKPNSLLNDTTFKKLLEAHVHTMPAWVTKRPSLCHLGSYVVLVSHDATRFGGYEASDCAVAYAN
ncbi:hypothetical protein NUW58_g10527 [Xylaria curta]|uniref:Uncharacterized protein n=1 Tax=Xylaria curta TaxID=42375 RepID=A0ACC1MJ52_9PEZI|nr:hypothetical protein NUW58_g10527 [Xylaria curta]